MGKLLQFKTAHKVEDEWESVSLLSAEILLPLVAAILICGVTLYVATGF